MSARISTILILGATRGIGEALARRFHSLGKKVIITGRGQDHEKLHQLARDLPNLEFRIWDLADLSALQAHVKDILTSYPQLDTVFLNAAIQTHYSLFTSPASVSSVVTEITTNLTAPILVAHAFAPHLLALAKSGAKTTIFTTTSSLAYFPVAFYPTYCATKAGLASFTKILRMQLAEQGGGEGMRVVEVVPPYVDTELDREFRERTEELQGGKEKAVPPLPLQEYVEEFFEGLERMDADGNVMDDVAVGFAQKGIEVWKEGNRKMWEASGMAG